MAVGVSHSTLQGLASDGMTSMRLRCVPNGIDPARLLGASTADLRARLGIPPETIVFGSVGSLIGRKALDVVLAAFVHLHLANPAHLLVAGNGPELIRLEALARDLGIAKRIHFLGNTDHPEEVYRAMDVNVLASRQEAFGLVLIEAAFCGVPSIGSSVDGIPEVIDDGETGLLFPRDDVAKLAAAFAQLAGDTAQRLRLGAAAKVSALARFTAARMAENFANIYSELLTLPPSQLGWLALRRSMGPYFQLPHALLRARLGARS
jgi:glycosyltransferase involved in cell wall biosynthesis